MKQNKTKLISYLLIGVAATMIIIAILVVLLTGKTEKTNTTTPTYRSKMLSCETTRINYPFFSYDSSDKKKLSIDVVFANDAMSAISLKYTLYYNSQEEIDKSIATNHAAMDLSFYEHGLGANSFDAYYSDLGDSMRMSLYVDNDNFDSTASQFFMIDSSSTGKLPETIDEYRSIYANGGLNCKIKE